MCHLYLKNALVTFHCPCQTLSLQSGACLPLQLSFSPFSVLLISLHQNNSSYFLECAAFSLKYEPSLTGKFLSLILLYSIHQMTATHPFDLSFTVSSQIKFLFFHTSLAPKCYIFSTGLYNP